MMIQFKVLFLLFPLTWLVHQFQWSETCFRPNSLLTQSVTSKLCMVLLFLEHFLETIPGLVVLLLYATYEVFRQQGCFQQRIVGMVG